MHYFHKVLQELNSSGDSVQVLVDSYVFRFQLHLLVQLRDDCGALLEGCEKDGRTFGAVKCVKCTIKGLPAAVIIPMRTHHSGVMELIAEANLRDRFGLEDGDEVEVEVEMGRG